MGSLGALLIGLIIAAVAGGVGTGVEQYITSNNTRDRNKAMENWLKQNYPELSQRQIEALVAQYGDEAGGPWDVTKWGDQSDWDALKAEMDHIVKAYEEFGQMPEQLTEEDLARIQQEAYDEIDAENQKLLDLYNQTYQNQTSQLQNEMYENAGMFGDYRNQVLTNEAMRQQAIAGSTRYELDRQQRNAITRGASAAQRLVANINTELGLQAQSAQQSLETSNVLAQNLLAHRQAQQGIRNAYMTAQEKHNSNIASVLGGQAERRYNYAQGRKQGAYDDYQFALDAWNSRINDYFQDDDLGRGIYTSTYGRRGGTTPTTHTTTPSRPSYGPTPTYSPYQSRQRRGI